MTRRKLPATEFTTRADAVRAAREALWGMVPFNQRECLLPERGLYSINVTAQVNGHLINIPFDNYGRVCGGGIKAVSA
jgi:hypothetical protein